MSAIAELAEKIANLTIAQAVELKNTLKEKYGIEPASGGVMIQQGGGAAGGAAAAPAPAAEVTEFDVILDGCDPAKKINVIKIVRELTGQGLAEAKGTVEGAPKPIKTSVDKKTAEDVKKKLEEAGGKVTVKPA